MEEINYYIATERDIPFVMKIYNENIESLHGTYRDFDTWKKLLSNENSVYYIVRTTVPVAWFRLDLIDNEVWLGMLQVAPKFHRQGIGRKILSFAENYAKDIKIKKLGIHTTEDNTAARALYKSAGYTVTEVGKCTTADGAERTGYTFTKNILL